MRHILIDTDTGSDDAVALVMALNNSNINVEAITMVAGNIPVEQGLQNALYTVDLCNKKIPVYLGEAKPLKRTDCSMVSDGAAALIIAEHETSLSMKRK